MHKRILYLLALVLFAVSAIATPCEDRLVPGLNCTVISPVLSCQNYTYSIYNTSTRIVTDENLTLLNDSIYQFTFTQSNVDGYLIKYCNNETRQIIVADEEDNVAFLIVGLFFILLTVIVAASMALVRNMDAKIILSIPLNIMLFTLMYLGRQFIQVSTPTANGVLVALDWGYQVFLVIFPIQISLIIIYLIYKYIVPMFKPKLPTFGKGGFR